MSDNPSFSEFEDDDEVITHTMICEDADRCSICLDRIDTGPNHVLDCGHCYHTKCAIDWFRLGNKSCPLCRKEDISNDATVVTFDEAVKRLLRKAGNKSAPPRLISAAKKLREARENFRKAKKGFRDYREENKSVFQEFCKKRKRMCRAEEHVEQAEAALVMPNRPYRNITMPLISYEPAEVLPRPASTEPLALGTEDPA